MKTLILSLTLFLAAGALYATGSNTILIPAAGHLTGAAGLSFQSDIAIHNLRAEPQLVELEWLPQSGSGRTFLSKRVAIAAEGYLQSDDFAAEILDTDGLGAITVTPILENGSPDPAAKLTAASRIWSPSAHGEVSQSFPPLRYSQINSTALALTGLRTDVQHRLNVGIVNLDRTSVQRFRISVHGIPSTAQEVALEPYSTTQVAIAGIFAQGNLRLDVEVLPLLGGGRLSLWTAYGSVVENASGDSWSSIGVDVAQ